MYVLCLDCENNEKCVIQSVAQDVTGCSGHSKPKAKVEYVSTPCNFVLECANVKNNTLEDFEVGDRVRLYGGSTIGKRNKLPRYLEDGYLTVIGKGKINVKCDYDGGKPFFIPPQFLKKV